MKGLFLALEGGDGAGKSSQAAMLADFLRRGKKTVHTLHFPRLAAKPYGEMIASYLRGDYGELNEVNPHLAALIYALDRREAAKDIQGVLSAGETLIADRYFFSNLAYQCARTANPEEKQRLADWIETLEYGHHAIPRPDITLYLDTPLSFSLRTLSENRSGNDRGYLKGGRDIHEDNRTLQERVRDEFLALARNRPREIRSVDCRDENGGMADKATILSRIIDALRHYRLLT
ncbi:MAG: dTMP kinase [Planctomycetes bacterium]|nr:dTMP kinase [Planctomycetota bacterium]